MIFRNLYLIQFSHSVVSDSLWPHGMQHARLPCPSPTPGASSNSCPSHQWCHPTISYSVIPFSSLLSIFPSIRVFSNELVLHIRWPKYWSFTFSVPPVNIQGWFPSGLTGLISLQSKRLSKSSPALQLKSINSSALSLLLQSNSHICTWLLEKPQLWLDRVLLAKWYLC